MATATAVDLVTREGYFNFFSEGARVFVEHWPAKHGKRAGYPRATSLSREAAAVLYRKLRARAL
jgi:hypothetical protein